MTAAHTPGPWAVSTCFGSVYVTMENPTTKEPSGVAVVLSCGARDVRVEQMQANARLIAAAPELAEAASALLHQITQGEASEGDARDLKWCADILRAALTKAGL